MKILFSIVLVIQLATVWLVVDTRKELIANAESTYNTMDTIMHDLTTRNVGDRFSRGKPAIY